MRWIRAHKKLGVILLVTVFFLLSLRPYNASAWSLLLGLGGWAIPFIQIHWRIRNKKGLGRFAPVLSMGVCCLSIWIQLYHYLEHIEDLPRADVMTARGVWIIALFLLATTLLLNLILAVSEKDVDRKMEEDYDLTI